MRYRNSATSERILYNAVAIDGFDGLDWRMKEATSVNGRIDGPPGGELLQRIAAALGVSVTDFYVLPEQHVFYVGADGSRWLLANSTPDSSIVRRLGDNLLDGDATEQSIADFLVTHPGTPQGQALVQLIERVLSMHLHLDMRS